MGLMAAFDPLQIVAALGRTTALQRCAGEAACLCHIRGVWRRRAHCLTIRFIRSRPARSAHSRLSARTVG